MGSSDRQERLLYSLLGLGLLLCLCYLVIWHLWVVGAKGSPVINVKTKFKMDFYAELALKPLTLTLGNKAIPDAKWLVFVIEKYKAFLY